MSIYGEFADEFRPRPSWWRIAVVSVAQFLLGVAIANVLLAIADGVILINAGIARALIIHPGTWRTWISIAPHGFDAEHALVAVGFLIVGEIVLDFLPMPRTLAMRHFAVVIAQSFAAFGAVTLAIVQPALAGICIALAAAAVVWRAEIAAVRSFNNVIDMKRPRRRALVWLLRVGIIAALAAVPNARIGELLFLGIVTLIASLARKPRDEYEETAEPELHEASAVLPLIAALVVGGILWLAPRVIVISMRGVSVRPWKTIESDLAKRLSDRPARR